MKFKRRFKFWHIIVGIICIAVVGFFLYALVNGFDMSRMKNHPQLPKIPMQTRRVVEVPARFPLLRGLILFWP
jgi:hypothetical protein